MRLLSPDLPVAQALFRPEIELVLLCARTDLTTEQLQRMQVLIARPLDWTWLVSYSRSHAVTPLVFTNLARLDLAGVPTAVLAELETFFQTNLFKNLLITRQLLELLNLLQERQVAVLPFKGPTLAVLAYGDLALRQFNDLDILIHPEDVLTTVQLLRDQGFRPQFELTPSQQVRYAQLHYEQAFQHPDNGLTIDLHWGLLSHRYSFSPSEQLIWQSWQAVHFTDLADEPVNTLSAEVLVLYLCYHAARHNWEDLSLLCDLAALLQRLPALDWESLLAQAGRLGSRRMLYLGLYVVHKLLDVSLPTKVLARLSSDPALPTLLEAVQKNLQKNPRANHPNQVQPHRAWKATLQQYWHGLLAWFETDAIYRTCLETFGNHVSYWFENLIVPTPLEWQRLPLPAKLFPLYYGLRPLRLVLKYLRYRRAGV